MGSKGKAKTKQKKAAKKVLKKAGKPSGIKNASNFAKNANKQGIDVNSLASSALGGVPFVGPLLGDALSQSGIGAPTQGGTGRGGARGVQLVDATLGNLGTISRRKALSILINKNKRPPRRSKPTFIQVPQGQSVVRV